MTVGTTACDWYGSFDVSFIASNGRGQVGELCSSSRYRLQTRAVMNEALGAGGWSHDSWLCSPDPCWHASIRLGQWVGFSNIPLN